MLHESWRRQLTAASDGSDSLSGGRKALHIVDQYSSRQVHQEQMVVHHASPGLRVCSMAPLRSGLALHALPGTPCTATTSCQRVQQRSSIDTAQCDCPCKYTKRFILQKEELVKSSGEAFVERQRHIIKGNGMAAADTLVTDKHELQHLEMRHASTG